MCKCLRVNMLNIVISLSVLLFVGESSSHSLLLATDSGIITLSLSSSEVATLHSQAAVAVDFRYNRKDVYFISNTTNQILYSYYSEYAQGLSDPVARVTSQSAISSLAVDWVSYRLYYGDPTSGTLFNETLSPSRPQEVISEVFELRDFALDPYERLIFFQMQGSLYSVALGDAVVNEHDLRSSGLSDLTKLSVDLHTKELYVICQRESDDQWMLGVKEYHQTAPVRSVFVGEELQGVRALAVFNGLLVWASPCEDFQCIYSCPQHSCHKDSLTVSWKTFEVINDIKYYTPLAQTPDVHTACLLCSHGCLEGVAACTCPENMELEDSGLKCRDKPPTWEKRMKDVLHDCRQGFDSFLSVSRPYWYVCGGLLLALLMCCICLLATVPCAKPDEEEADDVALHQIHHPHCPRRQTQR